MHKMVNSHLIPSLCEMSLPMFGLTAGPLRGPIVINATVAEPSSGLNKIAYQATIDRY
jgi:hypothetical protein